MKKVLYGHYFQTVERSSMFPVIWDVIDADERKAYLISDMILETMNESDCCRDKKINRNYENSYLREYVASLATIMFTEEERGHMFPLMNSSSGDLISIPSVHEVCSGNTKKERKIKPTAFAEFCGVKVFSTGYSHWYTSTPGNLRSYKFVGSSGDIRESGTFASPEIGIRPCIMVDRKVIG